MQYTAIELNDLSVTHGGNLKREGASSSICYAPFEFDEPVPKSESRAGARPVEVAPLLLVSPYAADHILIPRFLADSGWQCRHCLTGQQAVDLLARSRIGVVLCERDQPDGSWRDVLEAAQCQQAPPSVIVCSRLADESLWVEVLSLGGYDVLVKPFDHEEVIRVVQAAWRSWKWACGKRPAPHVAVEASTCATSGRDGHQEQRPPLL
jgi:DNA-binding response OmpR family regulator